MDEKKLIKILEILNDGKKPELIEKLNIYSDAIEALKNKDSVKKVILSLLSEKILPEEINKKTKEKLLNSKEKNLKNLLKQ